MSIDERFAHLTSLQRNRIFTALNDVRRMYAHGLITTVEYGRRHRRAVMDQAAKYGVSEHLIRRVCGHVVANRIRRGMETHH